MVDFLGGEPIYESLAGRLRLSDQRDGRCRGRLEEMTIVVAPSALEDAEVRQLQRIAQASLNLTIRRARKNSYPMVILQRITGGRAMSWSQRS